VQGALNLWRKGLTPSAFGVGAGYFAAALVALLYTRQTGNVAMFWPADGIAIAALLLTRKYRWPPLLAMFAGSGIVTNMIVGDSLAVAAAFTFSNLVNIAVATWFARRWCNIRTVFVRPERIMQFIAATVLVAPAVSAVVAAVASTALVGTPFVRVFYTWFMADAVGALVVIPCLAIATLMRRHGKQGIAVPRSPLETVLLLNMVLVVSMLVFGFATRPLLFLPLPFVLLATMRLGPIGAAAGTLIVAIVGGMATALDAGPLVLVSGSPLERALAFQFFIATIAVTALPIGAFLAQRNRLMRSLQQREREYRGVVDNVDEVIFRTDAKGRWTFLNPAWSRVTGLPVGDAINRSFLSFVHPDDRPTALANLAELYARKREDCRQDLRFTDAAGTIRWASVLSQLALDEDGNIVGTFGTLRDISERKAIEDAIAESEERYRLLAENAADVVLRLDHKGFCRFASPSIGDMTGDPAERWVGRSSAEMVHPDDLAMVGGTFVKLLKGDLGTAATVEFRMPHRDGHWIWVETTARRLLDAQGRPDGTVSSIRDVSDRKAAEAALAESEERYRLLAENAADVVLQLAPDGTCRFASPSTLEMTGHRPEDIVGKTTREFIHPDDLGKVARLHREVVEGLHGDRAMTVEYRSFRGDDGAALWLETTTRRLLGANGEVEGVVSAIRDITWRKELERQLTEARDAAQAAAKELEIQAATDALTGLASRRYFLRRLDEAVTTGATATLGIVDLDHFKRINDTYGHDAGDAVLRRFGDICRDLLPEGIAGRLGGEEFAVLLADMTFAEAGAVLERLRAHVAAEPVRYNGEAIPFTISIGAAESDTNKDPAALLVRADRALYGAKREGRNRLLKAA
jgi:diguanylate cyclase (GGDEF)-like protein/PAS domain S-box-containing protein